MVCLTEQQFSGCSTDTEPSAKTIAYLIDRIKENQIQAVFYLELFQSPDGRYHQ